MRVEVSEQAFSFVMSQALDARKNLRSALRALEAERGDIKALEGRLSGYHRLRVGPFRIIFRSQFQDRARRIRCEFIERRSVVYEMMETLVSRLKS